MSQDKIKRVFQKLRKERESEIARLKQRVMTPEEKEILYLVVEDSGFLLEEIQKHYLSGEYSLATPEEFGNSATLPSADKELVYTLAYLVELYETAEGELFCRFSMIPKQFGTLEFLLMS